MLAVEDQNGVAKSNYSFSEIDAQLERIKKREDEEDKIKMELEIQAKIKK